MSKNPKQDANTFCYKLDQTPLQFSSTHSSATFKWSHLKGSHDFEASIYSMKRFIRTGLFDVQRYHKPLKSHFTKSEGNAYFSAHRYFLDWVLILFFTVDKTFTATPTSAKANDLNTAREVEQNKKRKRLHHINFVIWHCVWGVDYLI